MIESLYTWLGYNNSVQNSIYSNKYAYKYTNPTREDIVAVFESGCLNGVKEYSISHLNKYTLLEAIEAMPNNILFKMIETKSKTLKDFKALPIAEIFDTIYKNIGYDLLKYVNTSGFKYNLNDVCDIVDIPYFDV